MTQKFLKNTLAVSVLLVLNTTVAASEQVTEKTNTTQLEKIVVTASGYGQKIEDAPASISVITAEDLEKRSYSDITDALKNVPGVFVSGGGSNQTISIRGMGADYTLFLIDGKPMNDGKLLTTNGGVHGANVNFLPPVEAIERIEVIRGPSSSLYGSDAMGGVINIITKKHQDKLTASIRTEYIKADKSNEVNNDATNTSLYLNAPLIKDLLSLQLNAGLQTTEESSLKINNKESNESDPEFEKKNIGLKFVLTPNKNNTITAEYLNTQQERTHTSGISLPITTTPSYSELEKNTYSLSHEFKKDKFTVTSYAQLDKDANNASTGRDVIINNNGDTVKSPGGINFETLTLNSQGTYFFDKHALTLGANYKDESLEDGASNSNVQLATQVAKMERYQWALFAEDTWDVNDKLALTLSGRFDKNEQFGNNFSPKAYAVYKATDSFTLKGGVISGYKAPSLRDSAPEYMLSSMGGAILPNPDLDPEKSLTYEVGFAFNDSDLGLGTSLMLFKTDFEDKITRSDKIEGSTDRNSQFYVDHPELVYNSRGYTYKYNVDKAEIKGIEFTTDYLITDYLKYRHSYTYTDSEQKSGADKGKPLNDISKHMFNVGLEWDINDQWLLWTQANYRSKTIGNADGEQRPGYTFVDLGAVYKYSDQLQFSTGIYNVANKNVLDDGNSWVLDGRRYSVAMNFKF
ncbi:TonB-dependent receptor [Acinetobacter portensis]|uniref:TonB-dependent receptor n=2 Tax=Acinetobacter TaxID=469 RepID=A0A6L6GFC2_9GAMM|nr:MULTISPECIES: TonB-dependent receptor [Acinetobacter]MCK7608294.1 TonB-dependent receptor [Acinetobacter portensis]MCK7639054.1 TonB-dependent receptor [Acinetobacter portensis]MDY6459462.1 TonB-dependent receptor [Acinetobacter faecalis]MDY6536735.1 TonB-dependent receptor [Acinetobacter faecalis]MTD11443.1 TonB-dependent receptor [Acinetobacter faecalis]